MNQFNPTHIVAALVLLFAPVIGASAQTRTLPDGSSLKLTDHSARSETPKAVPSFGKRPSYCAPAARHFNKLPTLNFSDGYASPNEPATQYSIRISRSGYPVGHVSNAAQQGFSIMNYASQRAHAYESAASAYWRSFDRSGRSDTTLSKEYAYWIIARYLHNREVASIGSFAGGRMGQVMNRMGNMSFVDPEGVPSRIDSSRDLEAYLTAVRDFDYLRLSQCTVAIHETIDDKLDHMGLLSETIGYFDRHVPLSERLSGLSDAEKLAFYEAGSDKWHYFKVKIASAEAAREFIAGAANPNEAGRALDLYILQLVSYYRGEDPNNYDASWAIDNLPSGFKGEFFSNSERLSQVYPELGAGFKRPPDGATTLKLNQCVKTKYRGAIDYFIAEVSPDFRSQLETQVAESSHPTPLCRERVKKRGDNVGSQDCPLRTDALAYAVVACLTGKPYGEPAELFEGLPDVYR